LYAPAPVETIGSECGTEPLGSQQHRQRQRHKSCSHSAHVAVQACTQEKCGNSSLHTREVWQFQLAHQRGAAIQACSPERVAVQACTPEKCGNSSLHTREVWQFKLAHQRGTAIQACLPEPVAVQACSSDSESCRPAAAAKAVDCKKLSSSSAGEGSLASLHVAKSRGAGPSARGRAELGGGISSSAERDSSFSWAWVGPWHLSARPTHSLKLGTASVKRHHTAQRDGRCNNTVYILATSAGAQADKKDLRL
jgi:hypothetical protein